MAALDNIGFEVSRGKLRLLIVTRLSLSVRGSLWVKADGGRSRMRVLCAKTVEFADLLNNLHRLWNIAAKPAIKR